MVVVEKGRVWLMAEEESLLISGVFDIVMLGGNL